MTATARGRGWVVLAIAILLSSLFSYVVARPSSTLAAAGVADATTSTISADVGGITVDGSATVTVQLKDDNGDPLTTGGDAVTLATTVGSITTPVDVGGGAYTATLTSEDVGQATITGTVNTVAITDDETVDIAVGAASAATSTTESDVSATTVDDGAVITVTLFDQYANALTTGGDAVTLSTNLGSLTIPVDEGDGTYTATLSSEDVGQATITGTVNTVAITDDETVDIAVGAASAATSTITAGDAAPNVDVGSTTITVDLFDQFGNALTTGGDVVALNVVGVGSLATVDDIGDGSYTATLSSTKTGLATITGSVNAVAIADDEAVTFAPGALDSFVIQPIGPQTAGTPFGVEITAYDQYDNIKTDYSGGLLGGLDASPGCSGCTPLVAVATPTYGPLAWTAGVGTASVTAVKAQTGAILTITDDLISDGETFAVAHSATIGGVTIDAISSQVAGTAFTVTVRAFDNYGNVKLDQTSGSLSGLASSPGCAGCAPVVAVANPDHGTLVWSNGVATTLVTAVKAQTGASITATVSGKTSSASFAVAHSATIGGVTIDNISNQIAGTGFTVTVRAFDEFGNVKLDQTGGSLSGLASSPGCADCAPDLAVDSPNHGTLSWSAGVGTTLVTAVNAQAGASITATVSGKTNSASFAVAHSATLAGFTIDTVIGTQTAGAPFDVTVRAYDPYGNLKLDNGVGVLSNLATSPGCPSPTCDPVLPAKVATYGTGDWSAGTKTFTGVTAYSAQDGAIINIVADSVGNTSNAFSVLGAAANRLFFSYPPMSFDGSPIDTKISQPIYHTCLPAAPGAADPCGAGSAPVTVLAIDAYGNRAGATSIAVKVTPTSTPVVVPTDTTTPGVAPYGEAGFGSSLLATSTAQGLTLVATASGADSASASLQAVIDLEACDEDTCDNNGDNFGGSNKLQKAASRINTEADFFVPGSTNVLLSTRFSPGTETNQTAACGSKKTIGDSTEVLISGSGVGGTTPASSIVLVMPKDTLKFYGITSRGTNSFDVCLGALNVVDPASTTTKWKGKKPGAKKVELVNSSYIVGRQWGVPADCGTPGLSDADPCIALRTKQAAAARAYLVSVGWTTEQIDAIELRDADVTIIVRKGSPWDGKMGLK